MYPAKHFQICEEESHKLYTVINDYPLATLLINTNATFPHISHIPFHLSDHDITIKAKEKSLIAHVSNRHPLAKKLLVDEHVPLSLVFHGEQSYISPHCHDDITGQVVPTWNYVKVHITGIATLIASPEQKYQQMILSSRYFEREQGNPWEITELNDKKIKQMLSAITFFKVTINNMEGSFKLSQNKDEHTKKRIAEQLVNKNKGKLASHIKQFS
jgi:transcriptional regulator